MIAIAGTIEKRVKKAKYSGVSTLDTVAYIYDLLLISVEPRGIIKLSDNCKINKRRQNENA